MDSCGPCFEPLLRIIQDARPVVPDKPAVNATADGEGLPRSVSEVTCGRCGCRVEEFAKAERGMFLCRPCIRAEDEEKLNLHAPLASEEKDALDLVASVIDAVSWRFWKPGDQPARILDWLYLGDLKEAMDLELLASKGITAVVNHVNWWELSSRIGADAHLDSFYASQGIIYLEADSEDRLFFDMVKESWPATEEFLARCRDEGRTVLVNCFAGHNRSACMIVCWLVVREGMSLLEALDRVLKRRGPILSNHGFRLQLVRLALKLQRLGERSDSTPPGYERNSEGLHRVPAFPGSTTPPSSSLRKIIADKRLTVKYDHRSRDFSSPQKLESGLALKTRSGMRILSLISEKVDSLVSQRMLSMELIACLVHCNTNCMSDYEYTNLPPVVIGNGFSGDVMLCQRRDATGRGTRPLACVKRFYHGKMIEEHIEKLKNEAVIYLSLEHPHIARLFDVYEDKSELSLVMEYCSGGTLSDVLRDRKVFGESDFQETAVQMLRALNYIHNAGIVHRDIKPRNWVYEGGSKQLKLIDFGFSVKSLGGDSGGGLKGCLGTLGYLAPEVIQAHHCNDAAYTDKCDIWSLGVVFYELLTGQAAFDREAGTCDGYTQECVMREIEDVTTEKIERLLSDIPDGARPFLRRMLTKDSTARPSASEALGDPYLRAAREVLLQPESALPVSEVLIRFRAYSEASTPSRALRLAQARSPTDLPWNEFKVLRATFDMFAARSFSGTVDLEDFVSVIVPGDDESEVRQVHELWEAVCPEQESLSYCEFLAALLPAEEDVFEDVVDGMSSICQAIPANNMQWMPSAPILQYLPLLRSHGKPIDGIFNEDVLTSNVVQAMSKAHYHWVIVRYRDGSHQFFDYMDVNCQLVSMRSPSSIADKMAQVMSMPVGTLANCSGHSSFAQMSVYEPFNKILRLIAEPLSESKETLGSAQAGKPLGWTFVRRVPIIDDKGQVVHVFSGTDFLDLAVRFPATSAVLRACSAKTFDRRDTIMDVSVMRNDSVLHALRIMNTSSLTICPVTSRELSGSLGGVVAMNVISAADLKWVMNLGEFQALDQTVGDFITWRSSRISSNEHESQRAKTLGRFNVVSVDADDSLHILASRMLASKLQRIFLSSQEIARIVGIVSSRDILLEVLDKLDPQSIGFTRAWS